MSVLGHLEPSGVFGFFEEICAIPHGSQNTKLISDYLANFARERHLEYYQDSLNNVIIIKEATKGYENVSPVIIQGHMDMVCEKTMGCTKDMDREGLDLCCEGDCIYAKDTTLGGDDGIAVAMALALLDAKDIPHPRIEAIITVDEEIGMGGAMGIDVQPIKGHTMINIDSEDEGIFTVSCAGGNITKSHMPVLRKDAEGTTIKISVQGGIGGHSGTEIIKGRANSNIILGRALAELYAQHKTRLVYACGGLKDNAIPIYSEAKCVVEDVESAMSIIRHFNEIIHNEYDSVDKDLRITSKKCDYECPMDRKSTQHVIAMLTGLPNGVQEMSLDMEGLVQTSLNLGILETTDTEVVGTYCVRSNIESQKEMLKMRISNLMEAMGGSAEFVSDYPGWQYKKESALRELMVSVYKDQYGKNPTIEAIHAGLECGLFSTKISNLDCISIGPDIKDIHTPRETLYIASTQRTWNLLIETLKRMK